MSLPDEVVRDAMRAAHGATPPGPCPDAEQLALYAEQALDADEAAALEAHAAACGRCQDTLAEFVRTTPDAEGAGAGLAATAPWWQGWRWLVPMAATAALVVVAVWVGRRSNEAVDQLAQRDTGVIADAAAPTPAAPEEAARDARANAAAAAASADVRAKVVAPPARLQETVVGRRDADAGRLAATQTPAPEAKTEPAAPAVQAQAARERQVISLADELRKQRSAEAPAAPAPPPPPAPAAQAPAQSPAFRAPAGDVRAEADAAKPAGSPADAKLAAASSPAAGGASGGLVGNAVSPGLAAWRVRDGRVERSADAGRTWQSVRLPDGFRATAIAAPEPLVCWAIGPQGLVRTIDGRTWTRITVPTSEALRAITASDAREAVVTTVGGTRLTVKPE